MSNLRIRFVYNGTTYTNIGSNWAIDDVILTGAFQNNITYGSWSPSGSGSGQTITVSPTTTTTYDLTSTSGSCGSTTSSKQIVVRSLPTATIGSDVTVCQNAAQPTIIFTGTGGTAPYTFTYNITNGSTTGPNQTVVSGSGTNPVSATVPVLTGTAGTYTYNLVSVKGQFCTSTQTGSASITVNPLPTQYTVTGGGSYCSGGSGVAIGLSNSQTGVNYQLFSGSTAVGSAVAGTTGSPISFGSQTAAGTYTVTATNSTTSCPQTMTGSVTVSTNPLPTVYNVTGGGGYCAGGTGVAIGLDGSQSGVNYQLFKGTTAVGTAVAGTGLVISFGNQTAAGTYTVTSTNATTSCPQNMAGSKQVIINPTPAPTITAQGPTASCTGAVTLRSDSATGNQWFKDDVAITLLGTSQDYIATIAGSYTVKVTNTTGCSGTSAPVDISFITNSWIAAVDSNWNTGANWCSGTVPTASTDAVIPSNAVRFPVLSKASEVKSLTIQSGAKVDLNDNSLTINGTLSGTGKFVGSTASSLTLEGTSSPVILNFDETTDATTNALGDLTIKEPITVNLASKLYISGTLAPNGSTINTNDNLTLRSTSIAKTARVAPVASGGDITGDVTVERFIPAKRSFRFLSPSVNTNGTINDNWMEGQVNSGVYQITDNKKGYGTNITGNDPTNNGFDPTRTNNPSLFTFNTGSQQWEAVSNTFGKLNAGAAYRLMVRGSRNTNMAQDDNWPTPTDTKLRATGTLITGTHTTSISGTTGKYTFIGNPYASPIDFVKLWTNNDNKITSSYYVWDPRINVRGAYVVYNASQDTSNNKSSQVGKNIQSGQAFFVQTSGSSTSLNFQESYKKIVDTGNTTVFRNPFQRSKLSVQLLLNLNEGLENNADGVAAFFDDKFTTAIGNEDSYKFTNLDENLAIDRNGTSLSMEGRPTVTADDTIPLQMWQFRQQSYYLRLTGSNFSPEITAFVKDAYLHKETPVNLSSVTLFPFTIDTALPASLAKDRFSIVFKPGKALPVTLTNVKAYQKDNGIQVDWTAEAETNIDRYEVEKSINGRQFDKGSAVTAKGNNSVTQTYGWFDENVNTGSNFYRIKVIEKSGAVKYSNVVKVNIAAGKSSITVFPNPIIDNLVKVQFNNMEKGRYSAVLYNTLGQRLYSSSIEHTGRSGTYTISLGRLISKGTYSLHIIKGDTTMNERVIVE